MKQFEIDAKATPESIAQATHEVNPAHYITLGEGRIMKQFEIDAEATPEFIAQVAHEVNRAYCMTLGDYSHDLWADAPRWQRDSAVHGVTAIMADPTMTPRDSHNSWMEEKLAAGWEYGKVKDPKKKTHPCLVPYEALSVEQRAKDLLFTTVVKSML